jgi:hypothetical protein
MLFWMVEMGNAHFFCSAFNREDAKRAASHWFGGDPDSYTVTPLTQPGDRWHIAVTVSA